MKSLINLFDFPEFHLAIESVSPEVERLYDSQVKKEERTARLNLLETQSLVEEDKQSQRTTQMDNQPDNLTYLASIGVCGDIPENLCIYNNTCHYRVSKRIESCSERNSQHCQAYKMFKQENRR